MIESRQVIRKKRQDSHKHPILNKSKGPNRHARRSAKAYERLMPQMIKNMKISKNLKDTKESGRIAKQKHIDEVKDRTDKRKELKKLNKIK